MIDTPSLTIQGLGIEFKTYDGIARVVSNLDLHIKANEIVGLVGESGCGKTVTAKTILGILPKPSGRIVSGKIVLKDINLLELSKEEFQKISSSELSLIPQDPISSLNPVFTVEQQIIDIFRWTCQNKPTRYSILDSVKHLLYFRKKPKEHALALEILNKVNIADAERVLESHPFQLSGGMIQRVFIGMALLKKPSLIIADEPSTALDVSIQDQILDLIENKVKEEKVAVLYITHNLGVARKICDRIYVMYAGDIVEVGESKSLFDDPKHPYTRGLIGSIPKIYGEMSQGIKGNVPNYYDPPVGCRFHPRCGCKIPKCEKEKPKLIKFEGMKGRLVACHVIHKR